MHQEVSRSPVSDHPAPESRPTSLRCQNSRSPTEERASRLGSKPTNSSEPAIRRHSSKRSATAVQGRSRCPSVSDCSALESLPRSSRHQGSRNPTESAPREPRRSSSPCFNTDIERELSPQRHSSNRSATSVQGRSRSPSVSDCSALESLPRSSRHQAFRNPAESASREPRRSASPLPSVDIENFTFARNDSTLEIGNTNNTWQGDVGTKWLIAALRLRPTYDTGEGRVNRAIYTAISKELKEQYRINRTAKQCENHGSYWRTKWHDRQLLLSQSGFGTDEMGRITCGEEAWQAFIAKVSIFFSVKVQQ